MPPYEYVVSRYNRYYKNIRDGDKFGIKNSVTNKYVKMSETLDVYSHIAGKDLSLTPTISDYKHDLKNNLNFQIINNNMVI